MMKKKNNLGIISAILCGALLLTFMLIRAFLPRIILPSFDFSLIVAISLVSLVIDHYIGKGSRHDYRIIPLYGALIFGVCPWAACFLGVLDALKCALLGAALLTAVTYLYDTLIDRLSSGPAAKAAPFISGFMLYLAAQCLIGII